MALKLSCTPTASRGHGKTGKMGPIPVFHSVGQVWSGDQESSFLPSFQVLLMLPIQGPHFENSKSLRAGGSVVIWPNLAHTDWYRAEEMSYVQIEENSNLGRSYFRVLGLDRLQLKSFTTTYHVSDIVPRFMKMRRLYPWNVYLNF